MRVSILIMAFLPPFRALTSASSARVAASLHWASNSFLSFSRFMASAALSSDILASLVISSRSALSWPSSASSFLLGSDGLVAVGQVSQSLVGVSELLLSSTTLAVSSLQKSTSFLKAVLHGSCPAVSGDLGIGGGRLGHRLVVDLGLGITDLESILLDGGLGLSIAGNGVLEGKTKVGSVSLKLLLHPESLPGEHTS